MAPYTESGFNVCPFASPGCRASCLNTTPRQTWPAAKRARILRTLLFRHNRKVFLQYVKRDLDAARRKAHKDGRKLVVRLNTMSDLNALQIYGSILDTRDQYLDYTKDEKKYLAWLLEFPRPHRWYHLTFSKSETNTPTCTYFLTHGGTVTVVVRDQQAKDHMLENGYLGFPAVDGDLHDRRWEDPKGHWIVLMAKGKAKSDQTGFVVDREVSPE